MKTASQELVILSGPRAGERLPLYANQTLGRADDCELRVDDDSVSRRHARLTVAEGGVVIEDLGSTNGTTVNGASIARSRRLMEGDRIAFGGLQTQLVQDGTQVIGRSHEDQPFRPAVEPPASASTGTTDGSAVAALILAIASYVVLPFVLAVVALFVARRAQRTVRYGQGASSGSSLVTFARVLAWINIVLSVLAVAAAIAFFVIASSQLPE